MRFNKMTSYAIRILNRIALEDTPLVTSRTIEMKEHIPQGILMKILRMLRQGGLVTSHQGRGGMSGGYSLNEAKEEISVYHVIAVMEDSVVLYPLCDKNGYGNENEAIYEKLEKLNQEYIESLKQIRII